MKPSKPQANRLFSGKGSNSPEPNQIIGLGVGMSGPEFKGKTVSMSTMIEDATDSTPQKRLVPFPNPSKELVEFAATCLDDGKGEEIVLIDLVGKTAIADAMIIASGRSRRHVASLADNLLKSFKESGYKGVKVEGLDVGEWVLLDAGDVIVHIFQPEIRDFYNLEKMWSSERPEAVSH